ncbi:MAG: FadR/GntR family transcriptional regulator [Acidimicrobiia bacterium]
MVSPSNKTPRASTRGAADSSASRRTAATLREEIIRQKSDRAFLGSEQELLDRLGVSRPTLRQAARILEAEQLLVVKRGVNGGFFGQRPSPDGVVHMASIVLRAQSTTIGDVARALGAVQLAVAPLAAGADAKSRAAFVAAAGESGHGELARRLAALSGSATFALFTDVLTELASKLGSDDAVRKYANEIAGAVKDGNAKRAEKAVSTFYASAEKAGGNARIESPSRPAAKAPAKKAPAKKAAAKKAPAKKAPAKKAAKKR